MASVSRSRCQYHLYNCKLKQAQKSALAHDSQRFALSCNDSFDVSTQSTFDKLFIRNSRLPFCGVITVACILWGLGWNAITTDIIIHIITFTCKKHDIKCQILMRQIWVMAWQFIKIFRQWHISIINYKISINLLNNSNKNDSEK